MTSRPGQADSRATTILSGYLSYADEPITIEWLEALDFELITRQDMPEGRVLHAELRPGSAVVMLASNDADYVPEPLVGGSTGAGLYLVVDADQVDALHCAAVAAGGRSLIAPEDTEWGARRARVLDPGGREWSLASYQPGRNRTA